MSVVINRKNIVRLFLVACIFFVYSKQAHAEGPAYTTAPVYSFDLVSNVYLNGFSRPIDALPSGYITLNVGGVTYNYYRGIFYQENTKVQKYMIVPPPVGGVIDSIPADYQMMSVGKDTYYEYNGVYFKQILDGYKVAQPPASLI